MVVISFLRRYLPRANDARGICPLHEGYQQKPIPSRMADENFTIFRGRVVRVGVDSAERIGEHGERFLERYAVRAEVGPRLLPIPFEFHPPKLTTMRGVRLTDLTLSCAARPQSLAN